MIITASDNENMMTIAMALDEADEDGRFAVVAHTIMNALRELPEQPIDVSLNTETFIMSIDYLNGHFEFPAEKADEYPLMETLNEDKTTITLPAEVLLRNVSRSIFAIGNEELRPVMNGIYFDLTTESMAIVASDGHKLVRNRIYSIKTGQPASFVMPRKPATLLKSTLPQDETPVVVSFNGDSAEITFGEIYLLCRLISGRYPNYNAVIPQDNPNQVIADRRALLGAMRRVSLFLNPDSLVRLNISQGKVTLRSEDIEFYSHAEESVVCDYLGMPMCIGFKGQAFVDILNNLECDNVRLELADPSRPGIVVPEEQVEGEDVVMLVMPMLLND